MDTNKLEELTKIFADPFEFLKYVRIQEPGDLALEYELWPHLVEFYNELERQKIIILIKPKQVGVSWGLAVRALRKIYITLGSNILMLSSKETDAQLLLGKVKIIYHNLPEWMQIFTLEPNSTEQFGFKEMGSRITALASTEKAGIGYTSDWVIHDEADFHECFKVNLGHTLATIADNPKRQATIVTTVDKTKPDSYVKELYKGAEGSGYPEAGTNNFHAMFFPYNVRPNRGEAFLEEQRRNNESTPWVVEANYPRTIQEALSPLATQSCFDKDKLTYLWDNAEEHPEVKQGFIYILCPPRVGTHYAAGVDVGEGVGLDYSCLTIVGKEGLNSEVCAVIYSNTIGTDSFAFEVDRLCRDYHNPPLVVDNIGIGRAVIDKLQELGYPRLFHPDGKDKIGWSLTKPNKRELAVKLVERINNGSLITRFKPQIKELMEYQWVQGYPEPTGKTHGDTVISLMLAGAVLDKVGKVAEASMYVRGKRIF